MAREYYSRKVHVSADCLRDLRLFKAMMDEVEPHKNHTLGGGIETLFNAFKDSLIEKKRRRQAERGEVLIVKEAQ